jgi:hypothetical protein
MLLDSLFPHKYADAPKLELVEIVSRMIWAVVPTIGGEKLLYQMMLVHKDTLLPIYSVLYRPDQKKSQICRWANNKIVASFDITCPDAAYACDLVDNIRTAGAPYVVFSDQNRVPESQSLDFQQ